MFQNYVDVTGEMNHFIEMMYKCFIGGKSRVIL